MKKIIILIQILLIITIAGCGNYESIYSSKTNNFNIIAIEVDQTNEINSKIKNSLKRFSNTNSNKEILIKINSKKTIVVTSKNSKGDPKTFSMRINLNLDVNINGQKMNNVFAESFDYNNKSNKFDLKEYERSIQNNLTDQIAENITLYLSTL